MTLPRQATFANLLRYYRKSLAFTQEELAEKAGLSRREISELERGAKKRPYRDTLARLADALHLTDTARATFEAAARGSFIATPPPLAGLHSGQGPLVGRRRELALLDRHLDPPGEDDLRAALLLIAGEPGIGKSRLLAETALRGTARGWRVMAGGCTRHSGQEPYEPLVSTLARTLSASSHSQLRMDLAGCSWLVRLLPELLDTEVVPAPAWKLPPEQERRLMFAAVARYLANLAGPLGTLLLLDDLQWAGADALDLLAAIIHAFADASAHSLRVRPVLRVVGAYRSSEVTADSALATLIVDLARESRATRCNLGPLKREEARQLAEGLLRAADSNDAVEPLEHSMSLMSEASPHPSTTREPDVAALVAHIVERAEGVPFFLVSCAQGLRAASETATASAPILPAEAVIGGARAAAEVEIPWLVVESIRQRVLALPLTERQVLNAASVMGRNVPFTLLLGMLGQRRGKIVSALEAACQAQLLVSVNEAPGVPAYQFAHDLICETIVDDLSAARRLTLHRAAARVLERLPEPERARRAAELAQHLLGAGNGVAALPYLLQAGDHATSVYAHAEAQRHYEMAIRLAATHHDRRSLAEAQVRLGRLLTIMGRLDDGRQQLEEAVAEFRAVDEYEGLARAELALAINLGLSARVEEALAHLLSVRDLTEPSALPGELALVYHWLSNAYLLISSHREEFLAAEQALDYAQRAGDPLGIARSQMRFGSALIRQGRIEEGCATVERYLSMAPQIGDVTDHGAVLWTLIEAYAALGNFEVAYRYLAEAETLAKESGHSIGAAGSVWLRGTLAFYEGAWEKCHALWTEAVEVSRAAQLPHFPYYLLLLGHLCYLRGDRVRANGYQAQAIVLMEQRSRLWFSWPCVAALAERDLLEGAPEAAARRLERPLEPLQDALHLDALRLVPLLAHAYLELGREAEADVEVGRALKRAGEMKHRLVLVDVLRVQALLMMRRREWAKAGSALDEALDLARTISYPYAEAKALYVAGQLHAAQGELARAREEYRAALAICDWLGEALYRPLVERAFTELEPPSAPP